MAKWRSTIFLLVLSTALIIPLARAVEKSQPTSVDFEHSDWQRLSHYRDQKLTVELKEVFQSQPGWKRLINQRRLAVALVDLRGDIPRFASINGGTMMYAASLPKIAILLAAYQSFEDGSLEETPEIHEDLSDMIRSSSNTAATRVMDKVGMKKIEAVLRDPRYGLYDEQQGGGLWVGKRYASKGPRRGDPMFNLSHGATADQVARFYFLLATGRLVSPERSQQILNDLSKPALNHKFVAALRSRSPNARLYRKSGTWRDWHADSVLVRGQRWRNYILVALVESENGERILRGVLPAVEELMVPPEYAEGGHDTPGSDPIP